MPNAKAPRIDSTGGEPKLLSTQVIAQTMHPTPSTRDLQVTQHKANAPIPTPTPRAEEESRVKRR